MGKTEKRMLLILIIIIVMLLAALVLQDVFMDNTTKSYSVVVLARAPQDRFLKGLDQAAIDYNVDLRVLSGYEQGNAQKQVEYLEREISRNVDAVVLLAEEPDILEAYLLEARLQAPVVTVRQQLSGIRGAVHVGVNDTLMGETLGMHIAGSGAEKECILLCRETKMPYLKERQEAVISALDSMGVAVLVVYCEPDPQKISALLYGRSSSILAVVDETMLLPVCKAARRNDVVFGCGYVSGCRPYLEEGLIGGLVVYSEYDAGYLSLQTALQELEKRNAEDIELGLYVANAESMYEEPLMQILFPIG